MSQSFEIDMFTFLRFKKATCPAHNNDDELKWRQWVDERFVRIITANIYRSWG